MIRGQSFNRFEKKFLVTKTQKDDLLLFLLNHMRYDDYSIDTHYHIYSVYYDTKDQNIIRQSVSSPKYKAKLRLRSYKFPLEETDPVFLEIKKKIEGKVTKRRVILRYKDALAYMHNRQRPENLDFLSNQVLNEIGYYLEKNDVFPNYYISYARKAFIDAHNTLRVTVDEQIIVRTSDVSLDYNTGNSLLEKDQFLIEIKSENNFPLWLSQKLSSMHVFSQSFSKYGHAYKMNILGDE